MNLYSLCPPDRPHTAFCLYSQTLETTNTLLLVLLCTCWLEQAANVIHQLAGTNPTIHFEPQQQHNCTLDEQLVMECTGHCSTGVHSYKMMSSDKVMIVELDGKV